jgi:hypothetical protein
MVARRGPAQPEASEAAPDPQAAKRDRLKEIVRSHLRNSPISRTPDMWGHVETVLGAIADDLMKEF